MHGQELQKLQANRAAFNRAYRGARYWVADEVGAYRADIAVARWMLRVLDRVCAGGAP
jgi:hypothetical protein